MNSYEELRRLMYEHDVTQADVVRGANVTRPTLLNWKKGKRQPTVRTLKKIAEYFDVPVTTFIDEQKGERMKQKERVLLHLQQNGEITSWDAIMQYGITRLADVIHKLRRDGYKIETETVVKKKGEQTVHYAKYRLEK